MCYVQGETGQAYRYLWFSLAFVIASSDESTKAAVPYLSWCSYTKNVFCECGNEENIFSLSINICRWTSCENCIPNILEKSVCENFYSCKVCGSSLDECYVCLSNRSSCLHKQESSHVRSKIKVVELVKRQTKDPKICGVMPPPKPGRVSCTVNSGKILCVGTCNPGYQFRDGSIEEIHFCSIDDGIWFPGTIFSSCEPLCEKKCQNGGVCDAYNICICDNFHRGDVCQYPITLCNVSKTDVPSSWQCNHTHIETTCLISCFPPQTEDLESTFQLHECSVQGMWNPPLPPCVKVHVSLNCQDPGDIPNGQRRPASDFPAGSLVSYFCERNYVLKGETTITCLPNGKWSSEKPSCFPSREFCPQPIVPENAEVHLFIPGTLLQSHHSSFLRSEIQVKLNRGIGSPVEESLDAPISPGSIGTGTRVQYKCRSRFYALYGSEYQTCLSSGTWSGYRPTCVPQCGISDSPRTPFITNGNATEKGQWPWQVGIYVWKNGKKQWELGCGGSLVNELWIVTAAHCVTEMESNLLMDLNSVMIHCGKYHLNLYQNDNYVQVKKIAQIKVQENYDFTKFDADIALLQLESPVELTSRVQPICLPTEESTRENLRDGKLGVVIGWGMTERLHLPETLRQSVLPVVSHLRCESGYREAMKSITVTKNMFCAGYSEGQIDTCNGDSGGPMMFLDETQRPKRWILEGIVSWGSKFGCGNEKQYAGFTKVKAFVSWIKMHI